MSKQVIKSFLDFKSKKFNPGPLYLRIQKANLSVEVELRAINRDLEPVVNRWSDSEKRKAAVITLLNAVLRELDKVIKFLEHREGSSIVLKDIYGKKYDLGLVTEHAKFIEIIGNLTQQQSHILTVIKAHKKTPKKAPKKALTKIIKWAENIIDPPHDKPAPKQEQPVKVKPTKPKLQTFWRYPSEENIKLFRATACGVIESYKQDISCLNHYGRARANELQAQVEKAVNIDELSAVMAEFIKTGKTEIDRHCSSFFRSPSRSSGTGDSSLRGMMIGEFIKHRHIRDKKWLDVVLTRSMLNEDVGSIEQQIRVPETVPLSVAQKPVKDLVQADDILDDGMGVGLR